jgi:hypothetical protein
MRLMLWPLLTAALLVGSTIEALSQTPSGETGSDVVARTPPRLSYTDGSVSFWRPGAPDWVAAQVNTPLAPGDELYTGRPGNLELQIGPRAYVRAWAESQLGLANAEPDFIQFRVTSGHVSFDLRSVDPGNAIEVNTPHAAFTIEHPGYYRVDVTPERTAFVVRRGGRAGVTLPSGERSAIAANEQVVLDDPSSPTLQTVAAPDLDAWDRWNYARTDSLLASVSARYVPPGVYGAQDLDQHGTWHVEQEYGPVWMPRAVPTSWVPYSTGQWVLDPIYGWTWIDTAPWGWAPFHHGRWVHLPRGWAWAPGPFMTRPVYAPALVVFFGGPRTQVSWVALGWGEPVIPWWGRPHFAGRPWWGGWGGPRVVNNVVVHRTTIVHVEHVKVYRNVSQRHAVVAVRDDHFGRRAVHESRVSVDARRLEPVRGAPHVKADAASLVPSSGRGARPPDETISRRVVATRAPARMRDDDDRAPSAIDARRVNVPAPRLVPPATGAPAARGNDDDRSRPSRERRPDTTPGANAVAPGTDRTAPPGDRSAPSDRRGDRSRRNEQRTPAVVPPGSGTDTPAPATPPPDSRTPDARAPVPRRDEQSRTPGMGAPRPPEQQRTPPGVQRTPSTVPPTPRATRPERPPTAPEPQTDAPRREAPPPRADRPERQPAAPEPRTDGPRRDEPQAPQPGRSDGPRREPRTERPDAEGGPPAARIDGPRREQPRMAPRPAIPRQEPAAPNPGPRSEAPPRTRAIAPRVEPAARPPARPRSESGRDSGPVRIERERPPARSEDRQIRNQRYPDPRDEFQRGRRPGTPGAAPDGRRS